MVAYSKNIYLFRGVYAPEPMFFARLPAKGGIRQYRWFGCAGVPTTICSVNRLLVRTQRRTNRERGARTTRLRRFALALRWPYASSVPAREKTDVAKKIHRKIFIGN